MHHFALRNGPYRNAIRHFLLAKEAKSRQERGIKQACKGPEEGCGLSISGKWKHVFFRIIITMFPHLLPGTTHHRAYFTLFKSLTVK